MDHDLPRELRVNASTKIVFLVVDGLGGLPPEAGGKTELETAERPNLNALAPRSLLGLAEIVGAGITPGSGAGHLALFGYEPLQHRVGRGILSALGIGLEVRPENVYARGNFATVDEAGLVIDRRAGRIPTGQCAALCRKLQETVGRIEDVEIGFHPERDHRFVLCLSGAGLGDAVSDTDPQRTGIRPLPALANRAGSEKTARIVNRLLEKAAAALGNEKPANAILLRGFARKPSLATFEERYGLKAAAVATYPMYRGLARLLGMDVLETSEEEDLDRLGEVVRSNWDKYDFFFVHVKKADSFGEDGNFSGKVRVVEAVDRRLVPALIGLKPDVFVVTGDHSSPAVMKSHSWHPVPFLLHARFVRPAPRPALEFGETACADGQLGTFPAVRIMAYVLAHAGRLTKFGA